MPVAVSYPGVYIEEIPSGVRTITGVATSITAFIGRTLRGPTNKATTINGFADFERTFGGLWVESMLGFAVRDFFLNGGSQAIIVRLFNPSFSTEEIEAASTAAKATAAAVAGADVAAAVKAAKDKAATYTTEPQKTAADLVAKAAEKAGGADIAAVKKAADDAVASAVATAAPDTRYAFDVDGAKLIAAYPGGWGTYLRGSIDKDGITDEVAASLAVPKDNLFNLRVWEARSGGASERFLNLTATNSARRIDKVLESESKLVRWNGALDPNAAPTISANSDSVTKLGVALDAAKKALIEKQIANPPDKAAIATATTTVATAATSLSTELARLAQTASALDGKHLTMKEFLPPGGQADKKGIYALEQADLFNLLCLPPYNNVGGIFDLDKPLLAEAAAYCEKRRAMLLVDPPSGWSDKGEAVGEFTKASDNYPGIPSKNAALFFPRLKQPNPLKDNQVEDFVPCGAVAGIFARTDTQRGVWKAPAGTEATLVGVPQLTVNLTDPENGELNPLGINCLRAFPVVGRVVWGARTLRGADQLADEWKYIPVRRTALFIEESLYRGTQWVVFEPNDEPLWAQIRLNVGAFMQSLFRQGAFQGRTPREAYFVKCDKETTTQNDINQGVVNVVVGFAPLKPAEFVIIRLQQMAGQIET